MKIADGYMLSTPGDAAAKRSMTPDNPHDNPVKAEHMKRDEALKTGKPVEETSESGLNARFPETGRTVVTYGGQFAGRPSATATPIANPNLLDIKV